MIMSHYHGHHQYRSPFGDTTYTKVFVGGLAWETPTDKMRAYFEQFGEILEAVIITDKNTGKSKGYGFVTFRDPAAAARACSDANPMIDGRRANCNIASFGRPRPSPPRGRSNQEGVAAQGQQGSSTSYSGMPTPQQTLATPYFYPYGYPYTAYGYQGVYNPQQVQQTQQYYAQYYGGSTSNSSLSLGATPFYYGGYSMPSPSPRPGFSSSTSPAHRITAPSYVYYPTPLDSAAFTTTPYPAPPPPPALSLPPSNRQEQQQQQPQQQPQSSTEESLPQQSTSGETENVTIHSEGPST